LNLENSIPRTIRIATPFNRRKRPPHFEYLRIGLSSPLARFFEGDATIGGDEFKGFDLLFRMESRRGFGRAGWNQQESGGVVLKNTRINQKMNSFPVQSANSLSCSSMENSLDEVQAMNTGLYFLCRINADFREVEDFLVRYPEALLFEGTQPGESVKLVVEEEIQKCRCFNQVCNGNRRRLLAVVSRGFEYYRGMLLVDGLRNDQLLRKSCHTSNWHLYADQLRAIERDAREINMQDMAVRSRVLESRLTLRTFQVELEGLSRRESTNRSTIALLACRSHRNSDLFTQRSVVEYKIGVATFKVTSLENEHKMIDQEKRSLAKMQLTLLQNAFEGCRRHVCEASKQIG
jgi:hypothetical protein